MDNAGRGGIIARKQKSRKAEEQKGMKE